MYALDDYNFQLPEHLIAQHPPEKRDECRLMVLDRNSNSVDHRTFNALPALLRTGDLLVVNNTAVIPARLNGKKETGGRVEVLVLDVPRADGETGANGEFVSDCLVKSSKRPKVGSRLIFQDDFFAEVVATSDRTQRLKFRFSGDFLGVLEKNGRLPLPPYIQRMPEAEDALGYQTVYAERKGAVAAPTAGLHFTRPLLQTLAESGIGVAAITLHVGYGTFLPVHVSDIRDHHMHSERFEIPEETAHRIRKTKSRGGRVVAVGTTCIRSLEYMAKEDGTVEAGRGQCDLFIYPGFRFKTVDAVITNFHLPKSTLMMLVSAFAGREFVLDAYANAVENEYRFFSYGDAMLIV